MFQPVSKSKGIHHDGVVRRRHVHPVSGDLHNCRYVAAALVIAAKRRDLYVNTRELFIFVAKQGILTEPGQNGRPTAPRIHGHFNNTQRSRR